MKLLKKFLLGACIIGLLGGLGFTQEVLAKDTNIAPVLILNYNKEVKGYEWSVIGIDRSMTEVAEVEYTVNGETIRDVAYPGNEGVIYTEDIRDMFNSLPRKQDGKLNVRIRVVDGDPSIDGRNWVDVSKDFLVSDLYCITLTGDENGTCIFSDDPDRTFKYVVHNEEISVVARPKEGYTFNHYEVAGVVRSTDSNWKFKMTDDRDMEIKCVSSKDQPIPTVDPTPIPGPTGEVTSVSIYTSPEKPKATDTSVKVYWNTFPEGTRISSGLLSVGNKTETLTTDEIMRGYKIVPIGDEKVSISLSVYDSEGKTLQAMSNEVVVQKINPTVITESQHADFITAGYKLRVPFTVSGTKTDIQWSCDKNASVEVYSGYFYFSASAEGDYKVTATVAGGNEDGTDYSYTFRNIHVHKKPSVEFTDGKFQIKLPEKVNTGTTSSSSNSSSSSSSSSSSNSSSSTSFIISQFLATEQKKKLQITL